MLGEGAWPDDRDEGTEVLGAKMAIRYGSCRLGVDLQMLRWCTRWLRRKDATARIAAGASYRRGDLDLVCVDLARFTVRSATCDDAGSLGRRVFRRSCLCPRVPRSNFRRRQCRWRLDDRQPRREHS